MLVSKQVSELQNIIAEQSQIISNLSTSKFMTPADTVEHLPPVDSQSNPIIVNVCTEVIQTCS